MAGAAQRLCHSGVCAFVCSYDTSILRLGDTFPSCYVSTYVVLCTLYCSQEAAAEQSAVSVRGASADVDGVIVVDVELKGLGGQPSLFVDRCVILSVDDVQVPLWRLG